MLNTNTYIPVDRPDVAKQSKPSLSFKEVRDCLFKFLMQAGIPFSGSSFISICTEHKLKVKSTENPYDKLAPGMELVEKYNGRSKEEHREYVEGLIIQYNMGVSDISYKELQREINRKPEYFYTLCQNGYSTTCKLENIDVDGEPVYVVVLEKAFRDLDDRKRKRLTYLMKQYNIIIFDEQDWRGIGLDISDKKWLKALTKKMLKAWAKKLFKKLQYLDGEINSSFTLNDVFTNLDKKVATKADASAVLDRLKRENLQLKVSCNKLELSKKFIVTDSHTKIIRKLVSVDRKSVKSIEDTMQFIINEINKINLRYSTYKAIFRTGSGKINISNSDRLAEFIGTELETRKKALLVDNLGKGVLLIRNTKTLQSIVVWLSIGKTAAKSFKLSNEIISTIGDCLVFHLHSLVGAKNKVTSMSGNVILSKHYKEGSKYSYPRDYRLPIYKGGPYRLTLY